MLSGPQSGGGSQTTPLFEATSYTSSGALANAQMGVGANDSGISFRRDYNSRLLPIDEVDTVGQTPGIATVQITGTEQTGNGYGPGYSYGSVTFSGAEQCFSSGCDNGAFLVFVGAQQGGQYSAPFNYRVWSIRHARESGICPRGATELLEFAGSRLCGWGNCIPCQLQRNEYRLVTFCIFDRILHMRGSIHLHSQSRSRAPRLHPCQAHSRFPAIPATWIQQQARSASTEQSRAARRAVCYS